MLDRLGLIASQQSGFAAHWLKDDPVARINAANGDMHRAARVLTPDEGMGDPFAIRTGGKAHPNLIHLMPQRFAELTNRGERRILRVGMAGKAQI